MNELSDGEGVRFVPRHHVQCVAKSRLLWVLVQVRAFSARVRKIADDSLPGSNPGLPLNRSSGPVREQGPAVWGAVFSTVGAACADSEPSLLPPAAQPVTSQDTRHRGSPAAARRGESCEDQVAVPNACPEILPGEAPAAAAGERGGPLVPEQRP